MNDLEILDLSSNFDDGDWVGLALGMKSLELLDEEF